MTRDIDQCYEDVSSAFPYAPDGKGASVKSADLADAHEKDSHIHEREA